MDLRNLLGGIDMDDLAAVVNLVAENRDFIAQLGRLPEVLSGLADSLEGAGGQAKIAAIAIVGDDGSSGARGALAGASQSLVGIVESLGKGIAMVEMAAEATGKVPLMDGPAKNLAGAAQEMSHATTSLGDLAQSMATIAEVLGTVGAALQSLGVHLDDSGTQAKSFAALPTA